MKEQQSPKLWLLVRCTKGWLVGLGIKEVPSPAREGDSEKRSSRCCRVCAELCWLLLGRRDNKKRENLGLGG